MVIHEDQSSIRYIKYRYISKVQSRSSGLKLARIINTILKRKGLTFDKVEWFADAIEMGAVKLPELQVQYQSLINR
jgi:hypothetical protein